jgi:CheY-like chemotaxis protein
LEVLKFGLRLNSALQWPIEWAMAQQKIILVAEDSAPNRQILVKLLTQMSFAVIETTDGKEAWDFLCENPDVEISALLTDYMMPNMNGVDLVKELRKSERFIKTPVVFISAVSDREQIKALVELQIKGFILKPIKADSLSKKLKELFPEDTNIEAFRQKYNIR